MHANASEKHLPGSEASIKSLAIRSSAWTLGGYGSGQVLRLGSHLILAWLLAPEAFGLMALVKVVQHGLSMFSDIGIRPAIIQNPRGDQPEFLNTAWTIQIIRGFCLWACSCLVAWPVAAMFARNDPSAWLLVYLLPVTGFGAVLQGLNSTALATLNKKLRLGRVTMLELSSQLVSLAVMIVWALIHPSVWAMVAGGLASAAYKMVASHRIVSEHPVRLGWDRQCASELMRFGKWIFLSTLFTFLALNLDKLLLGNVLSLADLGLYSIAFVFGKVALYTSTRLGGTVLYPIYSKYQSDPVRMMSIALRAREAVLWAGATVSLVFAIGGPLFFQTLWDQRYHGAGVISQWVAIYVWSMIVLVTMERIPLALGNSRALFYANVWRCLGTMFAVVGYLLASLPGFIVGLAFGPMIAHFYLLKHLPCGRQPILMQGIRFTAAGGAYGVFAVLFTRWVQAQSDWGAWVFSVVVCLFIPVCCGAFMVWRLIQTKPQERALAQLEPGVIGT